MALFAPKRGQSEEQWMSVSDLMTVVMVLFLFIALMINVASTTGSETIVDTQNRIETIRKDLCFNLKEKLQYQIDKEELTVTCDPIEIEFNNKKFNFSKAKSDLSPLFQKALDIVSPIIVNAIHENKQYRQAVGEFRVEGHSSTKFKGKSSRTMDSFKHNMELSQNRARNVLKYCLGLEPFIGNSITNKARRKWAYNTMTANGVAFGRIIRQKLEDDREPLIGKEDMEKSRRVTFRLLMKTGLDFTRKFDTSAFSPDPVPRATTGGKK